MNLSDIIDKDNNTVFIFYTQRNFRKTTIRQIMDYRINQRERDALKGLPHLARLTYLEALRPYMDYATGVIGIKRGISYQSLTEELYVEPHPGYQGGSPSRPQMRRVLKTLERSGLVSIQSVGKKLIIKCELATWDYYEQKQVVTKPSYEAGTKATGKNGLNTENLNLQNQKAGIAKTTKAGTPPESGINNIFFEPDNLVSRRNENAEVPVDLSDYEKNPREHSSAYVTEDFLTNRSKMPHHGVRSRRPDEIDRLTREFEKFWSIYPLKQSRNKALEAFNAINPTKEQSQTILDGLIRQVEHYNQAKAQGYWMPNWKHPNNWLTQQCWKDEILELQGNDHARSERRHQPTGSSNLLWESCKGALEAIDDGDPEREEDTCIIDFQQYRYSTH